MVRPARAPILAVALILASCGLTESPGAPSAGSQAPMATPDSSEVVPADCVNPPRDVTDLIEQRDPAACYGSADLTLEAHATTFQGVVDCGPSVEPAWLHCGGPFLELFPLDAGTGPTGFQLAARSQNPGPSLWAVIHPDSGLDIHRGIDAPVTVTGHFDDPAAQTCHYVDWPESMGQPDPGEPVKTCRSQFAITELALLDVADPTDDSAGSGNGDGAFAPHDILEVVTTDLVVRSAPGVGPGSEIFDWQLDAPALLYVFDGPVLADGYDWYQVMPAGIDYLPTPYGLGWVAAGSKEGEAWIAPAAPDCPEPSTETIAALSGLGGLACFGGTDLVLEGDLGGCRAAEATESQASVWPTACSMTRYDCCPDVVPYPSGTLVWFEAVLSLPFDEPQATRITAHFDDARAAECTDVVGDGAGPVPAGWGRFMCRTSLVVSDSEPAER